MRSAGLVEVLRRRHVDRYDALRHLQGLAAELFHQAEGLVRGAVGRREDVRRVEPRTSRSVSTARDTRRPTFWAACARCEALVAGHDDAARLGLLTYEEEDDVARQAALAAFRAADLGSEGLPEG